MSTSRAPTVCPRCGSREIDSDPARGDSSCESCGAVIEENAIVSEVGFAEDARGRASMIGQHVSASGRPSGPRGVLAGFSREATAMTMDSAKRRIWHLVSALRLTTRHAESALRLFRIAVDRNFHKGRRMTNVCCACLYVTVRIERSPHMLIDFSDILETNVYVLGNTFLKFAKILSIELPIIDPSLYIHRFALKLEFGNKTQAVAMSALRLLARMTRDWMSHGRRPNGLCGAALIIAARMHNFYRSQSDVIRVVRIGNMALRDRLLEFDRTPAASLTMSQIHGGGGDDGKVASLNDSDTYTACDPPAFQRNRDAKMAKAASDAAAAEREALEKAATEKAAAIEGSDDTGRNASPELSTCTPAAAGDSSRRVVAGIDVSIGPGKEGRTEQDAELEKELADALANKEMQELELESRESAALSQGLNSRSGWGACAGSASEVGSMITPERPFGPGPDADKVDEGVKLDDDLSDLDEEDVALYLNTEEEYRVKEAVWMEVNKDYLERQARLEKLKREDPEEYKRQRPSRESKRRKKSPVAATPAKSPAEAVTRVMSKSSSSKLNYTVLKQLKTGRRASAPV